MNSLRTAQIDLKKTRSLSTYAKVLFLRKISNVSQCRKISQGGTDIFFTGNKTRHNETIWSCLLYQAKKDKTIKRHDECVLITALEKKTATEIVCCFSKRTRFTRIFGKISDPQIFHIVHVSSFEMKICEFFSKSDVIPKSNQGNLEVYIASCFACKKSVYVGKYIKPKIYREKKFSKQSWC